MIPGLTCEPELVLRRVALDEVELLRPRADDRHVAAQDVDQLRQLVDARPAQHPADARHARVGLELEHRVRELVEADELREPRLGVSHHRAELEHLERPRPLAAAGLAEEDRQAGIEQDREPGEQEERKRHREDDQRDDEVERPA